MNATQQQAIRESAYQKWENAGGLQGDELKFWLQAEKEFLSQKEGESKSDDDIVQENSEESFPASDPPAWKMTSVGVHPQPTNRGRRRP